MATQTGSYDFKAAKAVQDNLDNLEVGGRNLLGRTDNPVKPTIAQSNAAMTFGDIGLYNTSASEFAIEDYDSSTNALVLTSSVTGNHGVSWYTKPGDVREGDTYTFSCRVKSSVAVAVHTHTAWRNGSATAGYAGWTSNGSKTITANAWTDYSFTFTPASTAQLDWELMVSICFTGVSTGVTFRVAHAKLERGNKATDWTPAPEDVSANIAAFQPYVIGTQTAATRFWTGNCPELSSLRDGQQITYWLPYAYKGETAQSKGITADELVPAETITTSYNNDWLKLTLADGSDSGWIPIYYGGTSRLTSHYGAANAIHLTYREGYSSAIPKGWWCDANYNTDDVYTRFSDTVIAGLNGVKRYSLNMKDKNGNWTSIMNQDNNTAKTGKTAYTGGLMLGNVLYHNSGSNIAAGGNTGQMKESQGAMDFRYSVNGVENASTTELQLRKPIYLVGSVHDDGLFYLNTTKWWTQTPNVEGTVYVQLGTAYSSYYAIFLSVNNPTYIYTGGELVEWEKWMSDEAAKVAGNYIVSTAANDVWIHTEDHGPNSSGAATTNTYGWRIGSVFELVRAGLSYLKMWVDGTVAKVRVGIESAGHSIFSPSGMEVFTDASTSVASFGASARIGKQNLSRMEIENDFISVYDKTNTRLLAMGHWNVDGSTITQSDDSSYVTRAGIVFNSTSAEKKPSMVGGDGYLSAHVGTSFNYGDLSLGSDYAELSVSTRHSSAAIADPKSWIMLSTSSAELESRGTVTITSNYNSFTFGTDGKLTVPGALDLGSALKIVDGGTGMTGVTSASSGVVTAASGTTIVSQAYVKWGKMCQVYVSFKRTSAVHVPASGNISNVLVFTLNEGYRPKIYSSGRSNGDGAGAAWYTVGTDGKVNIGAMEAKNAAWDTSTGDLFSFFATFILP